MSFISNKAHLHLVEAVLELIGLVGGVDVDQDETGFGRRELGQVPFKTSNVQMLECGIDVDDDQTANWVKYFSNAWIQNNGI